LAEKIEVLEKPRRGRGKSAEVQARWEELAQLREDGVPAGEAYKQIAEKYGISASTVNIQFPKWARENGREHLLGSRGGARRSSSSGETVRISSPRSTVDLSSISLAEFVEARMKSVVSEIDRLEGELAEKKAELENLKKLSV
jgi:uncharacterized small protein (DUF1192 family)